MRGQTKAEFSLASDGAELPPCAALMFRADGQGWTAIYSPSLSGSEPPRPRGLLTMASLRSEGARFDPEQIREALQDAVPGIGGTTTIGTAP